MSLTVLCTCLYAGRVECGSIGSLSINVFFSLSFLVSHCPMYMSVCRQGQVWQYRFSLNQCLLLCRSLCLTVLCTCLYVGRVKCDSIGSLSINVFFSLSFLVSHCPMYMSVCRQGQVWQYRFSLNQCLLLCRSLCLTVLCTCLYAGRVKCDSIGSLSINVFFSLSFLVSHCPMYMSVCRQGRVWQYRFSLSINVFFSLSFLVSHCPMYMSVCRQGQVWQYRFSLNQCLLLCRSLCLTVLCTCLYVGRVKCDSIGSLSINVFFSLSFLVSHCPMYMSVCRQGRVWQYRFSLSINVFFSLSFLVSHCPMYMSVCRQGQVWQYRFSLNQCLLLCRSLCLAVLCTCLYVGRVECDSIGSLSINVFFSVVPCVSLSYVHVCM